MVTVIIIVYLAASRQPRGPHHRRKPDQLVGHTSRAPVARLASKPPKASPGPNAAAVSCPAQLRERLFTGAAWFT